MLPWLRSILVAAAAVLLSVAAAASPSSFAVFGYLPDYRLNGFNYEAAFQSGLTHLIFFSLEVDPVTLLPTGLARMPTAEQVRQARVAADRVGGKILLAFGGDGRSGGFGSMVATAATRARFLDAADAILVRYGFDGIDYNWEYPADAREWGLWGTLFQESKSRLRGGNNVVTFTIYQDASHARYVRELDLLRYADYVHCMSYDRPGKHSTLALGQEGVVMGRNDLGGGAITARKFTLGLPFYARHTQTGEAKTYAELSSQVTSPDNDMVGSYFFNNVGTLAAKTRLAMAAGLGGVMIWELGQDVQPLGSAKSLMKGIQAAIADTTPLTLPPALTPTSAPGPVPVPPTAAPVPAPAPPTAAPIPTPAPPANGCQYQMTIAGGCSAYWYSFNVAGDASRIRSVLVGAGPAALEKQSWGPWTASPSAGAAQQASVTFALTRTDGRVERFTYANSGAEGAALACTLLPTVGAQAAGAARGGLRGPVHSGPSAADNDATPPASAALLTSVVAPLLAVAACVAALVAIITVRRQRRHQSPAAVDTEFPLTAITAGGCTGGADRSDQNTV